MYSDDRVNEMLVPLEDSMLAKFYPPSTEPEQSLAKFRRLDWSGKAEHRSRHRIPLPIYGLEFTLSLYFRDTRISLSNITDLNLSGMNLKGNIRSDLINDRTSSMDIEIRVVGILEHRQQLHTIPPIVGNHPETRKDISNRKPLLWRHIMSLHITTTTTIFPQPSGIQNSGSCRSGGRLEWAAGITESSTGESNGHATIWEREADTRV
jgi:hypothetical protein